MSGTTLQIRDRAENFYINLNPKLRSFPRSEQAMANKLKQASLELVE